MTTKKTTTELRRCTGSARFGIEPHEAATAEFPKQPIRLVHGNDADPGWREPPRAVSMELERVLLEAGYDAQLMLFEDANYVAVVEPGSEVFDAVVQLSVTPAQ